MEDKELTNPLAHDLVLVHAAVLAAVHLNHAAVIHLRSYRALHLQHQSKLGCKLEAHSLARLWPIGTHITEVERSEREQLFDPRILDAEGQLKLLLEQADVDFFELKFGRPSDAMMRAGRGYLVDETLELSEDGLHVGMAGLNGDLAELAGAVAKENTGQSVASHSELEIAGILHVGCTACKGWGKGRGVGEKHRVKNTLIQADGWRASLKTNQNIMGTITRVEQC